MSKHIPKRERPDELLPNEVWAAVVGFDGLYMVSSLGRVKSLIIKNLITYGSGRPGEYKRFVLHKKGKHTYKRVHQLVSEAFIPNPGGKTEINHIDGNKSNNRVENLEWSDRSANNKHAFKIGLNRAIKKFPDDVVREIKDSSLSNSELSKIYGINYKYIWSMRKGLVRKNA